MDDALAQEGDDAAGGGHAGSNGEHGVRKPPSQQRRDQRTGPCAGARKGNGNEQIQPQQLRALDARGFCPTPVL